MVTSTLVLMLTVHNVIVHVILVLKNLFVLNVPHPESKDLNHIVVVHNTNILTKTPVNVLNVTINVTLVKVLGITVLNVKILELQPLTAHVQLDIMKLLILSLVTNVTQDVLNVQIPLKNVTFVLMTEFLPQSPVHVSTDLPKLTNIVNHVTFSVTLVGKLPLIVLNVLKTESMTQLVDVQMVHMKLMKPNVQLVKLNV